MALDVLVVGGGGREHALVSGLARSARIGRLFCAPGNVGIGRLAELVPIPPDDLTALADFAEREHIDLTVVGPRSSVGGGHRRGLRRAGAHRLRPVGRGRADGGLKSLRQGRYAGGRRADRAR